jgi:hypothetical protein
MRYSSRFWLYAPLALFVTLAAIAMGHWWVIASAFDKKLHSLNGHQAVPGVTVAWDDQTISGFPFRLDVVFRNMRVRAEAPRGPVIWQSERFALHALTYGRTQDIFEAAGRQSLAWTDIGRVRHRLTFLPGSLRASTIADARGLSRFDLDLVDAGGADGDGVKFTAARLQLHMRRDPKADALDLMLSAQDFEGPVTPFGDHIKKLDLYARITEGSAFSRLLSGQAGWMDAIMAWRHLRGEIVAGPVDVQSGDLTTNQADPELESRLKALLFPFY